jgi:hypothetical protein
MFFKPVSAIKYVKEHCIHAFECAATNCLGKGGHKVCRYLDTGNAKSTGNLHKHAKICGGEHVVATAVKTCDVWSACEALEKLKSVDSSITAAFQQVAKDKVTTVIGSILLQSLGKSFFQLFLNLLIVNVVPKLSDG